MVRSQQPGFTLFAVGMMGLGILALIYGDFALVWQPVAAWVPGRTGLAYASGALMLLCGAGLLFRVTVKWSVRILFPYLIVWALLKVPAVVAAWQIEGVWLGIGELLMLLAGGWTLFAVFAELPEGSLLAFASGERGIRIARILFAIWVIPVGLSHLFYVKQTVELIPAWLPFKTFWAYLTGIGHMASGVGVLFSILPRLAAWSGRLRFWPRRRRGCPGRPFSSRGRLRRWYLWLPPTLVKGIPSPRRREAYSASVRRISSSRRRRTRGYCKWRGLWLLESG
jgi:uncharacterized membrane protein